MVLHTKNIVPLLGQRTYVHCTNIRIANACSMYQYKDNKHMFVYGRLWRFCVHTAFFSSLTVLCSIMEVPETVCVCFVKSLRRACFCGIILSGDAKNRTFVHICNFRENS